MPIESRSSAQQYTEYLSRLEDSIRAQILQPFATAPAFPRTSTMTISQLIEFSCLGIPTTQIAAQAQVSADFVRHQLRLSLFLVKEVNPDGYVGPEISIHPDDYGYVEALRQRTSEAQKYAHLKSHYPLLLLDLNHMIRIGHPGQKNSLGIIDLITVSEGWDNQLKTSPAQIATALGYKQDTSITFAHHGALLFLNKLLDCLNEPETVHFTVTPDPRYQREARRFWKVFVAQVHRYSLSPIPYEHFPTTSLDAHPLSEVFRYLLSLSLKPRSEAEWEQVSADVYQHFGVDISWQTLRQYTTFIKGNPGASVARILYRHQLEADIKDLLARANTEDFINTELQLARQLFTQLSQGQSINRLSHQYPASRSELNGIVRNTLIALWETPFGKASVIKLLQQRSRFKSNQDENLAFSDFLTYRGTDKNRMLGQLHHAVDQLYQEFSLSLTPRQRRILITRTSPLEAPDHMNYDHITKRDSTDMLRIFAGRESSSRPSRRAVAAKLRILRQQLSDEKLISLLSFTAQSKILLAQEAIDHYLTHKQFGPGGKDLVDTTKRAIQVAMKVRAWIKNYRITP